jgi:menaquinone-dependent protoporphyrinogen oxidase
MDILIAYASKHGSTHEIARVVAQELRAAGHGVAVRDVEEIHSIEVYDAIIIGSAIYMGRWMAEAQEFVERNQDKFGTVPVWLFSSGPLGEDVEEGTGNPHNIEALMAMTKAVDCQVFDGRLDKEQLGLGERMIVRMVKAPAGDFRDWNAIREWAGRIAAELNAVPVPA